VSPAVQWYVVGWFRGGRLASVRSYSEPTPTPTRALRDARSAILHGPLDTHEEAERRVAAVVRGYVAHRGGP